MIGGIFALNGLHHIVPLLFLAALLAGCASSEEPLRDPTGEKLGAVISQPATDLNLRRKDIPAELQLAWQFPYPEIASDCQRLSAEITTLDNVLGPDVDAPERKKKSRSLDPWSMAQDAAGSFVLFRGVVRRLSGAVAAEEAYRDAVLAGFVKRAYLRGVLSRMNCERVAKK